MFKKVHSLDADTVIEFYLNQSNISTKHKKSINRAKTLILQDATIYQKLAVTGKYHLIKNIISAVDDNSKKSLELLYNTYVKKSGVRKFLFDQTLLCAGCQKNYATDRSTLDHFLPSSNYPNFYVLPWNLVPTCGDCNRIKNDVIPQTKSDNLPHPYFNPLIFKKNWLKIVINQMNPLTYELAFDDQLRASEKQMVLNHLTSYKLENAFVSHISTLFDEHDDDLQDIFTCNGAQGVKEYLETLKNEVYISKTRVKKYWPINIEHCFLSALYESDWFCNHYYR